MDFATNFRPLDDTLRKYNLARQTLISRRKVPPIGLAFVLSQFAVLLLWYFMQVSVSADPSAKANA